MASSSHHADHGDSSATLSRAGIMTNSAAVAEERQHQSSASAPFGSQPLAQLQHKILQLQSQQAQQVHLGHLGHQRHHTMHFSPSHHLHNHLPPAPSLPLRTASSTPMTSPGLFSPAASRHLQGLPPTSVSDSNTPAHNTSSPYLHPLQTHKVRETRKALIDSDVVTGRKLINQYEVIEEIGRGVHGKVKLARNVQNSENVAIKIIPRYSKKRRLGKVTAQPEEEKTKKEIAILKKIRHPNVVALFEVIDDLDFKKIYMVLEHVELGEVVWRKKGLPHICHHERRRVEREMRGEPPTEEEERYDQILERRQALKDLKRAKMAQHYAGPSDFWSVEHGAADDANSRGRQSRIPSKEDFAVFDGPSSYPRSRSVSRGPTRSQSSSSMAPPSELDEEVDWEEDIETPGPLRSKPGSSSALEGSAHVSSAEDAFRRGRSPSMADSIISHMSSVDYNHHSHDAFADDYSYVPCFTLEEARNTFRDTVLGLEYLHYQGVVHRDIKPANLLWTRDHRVKISDFGVSYFGRPTRDGENDETVSESEARDFDDDLELAKTVGTPAFFAPELCYTDPDKEQPKVSEQIDVWSLGVTLYCLIYARIPFLAEDEFQMFKKIASDDVYIPRRRLRPVHPSTSPSTTSLYKRHNTHPYRDDNNLEYEEVDNLLCDLLRQMLIKNPEKRIRLRDIKRHPWVVQGIQNPIGWLDDTDPARPSSGRRIQVDESEMSSAVIPLRFLERARSAVKKAVGKVMYPLVDRSESKSRRRATSSVASSAGESLANHAPSTPQYHTHRRRSIRPDDYFTDAITESPVTYHNVASNTTSRVQEGYDPLATVLPPSDAPRDVSRNQSRAGSVDVSQSNPNSPARASHRRDHFQGGLGECISRSSTPSTVPPEHTISSTPMVDGQSDGTLGDSAGSPRPSRALASATDDSTRSHSVDRALFVSADKKAQAQVAVSTAMAPGNIHGPKHPRGMRSVDLTHGSEWIYRSSSVSSPQPSPTFLQRQPQSDPSMFDRQYVPMAERPSTAHRLEAARYEDRSSPLSHLHRPNSQSWQEARTAHGYQVGCETDDRGLNSTSHDSNGKSCSTSLDVEGWHNHPGAPTRGNTMTTAKSSSTESIDIMGTPLTSPSEVTSPASGQNPRKMSEDRMLAFQSDPSLPALLSNASSVSADLEGELLGRPGLVSSHQALLESTDSLTPPAMAKGADGGYPFDQLMEGHCSSINGPLQFQFQSSHTDATSPRETQSWHTEEDEDDDDDGSDDGILIMAKKKKKPAPEAGSLREPPVRRNTNMSTASTETARKVAPASRENFASDASIHD